MRRVLLVLLTTLLLSSMVGAGPGHGEDEGTLPLGSYLNHIELWSPDLSGGEARMPLAFSGGPLHEDWLLAVHGVVENGSVQLGIGDGGPWDWDAGEHTETMRIEHAGVPEIWARPLDGNATLRLYYDVTCDCVGKAAPMDSGPLWFNTEAAAGDEVSFLFNMQPGPVGLGRPDDYNGTFDVAIRLVEADPSGSLLTTLQESVVSYDASTTPTCLQDGTWGVCQWFNFTAPHDGRQAVLLSFAHERPDWGVLVRPTEDVRAAGSGEEAPGLTVPMLLALLAAWALLARRR